MLTPEIFKPSDADVAAMVAAYPFAILVSLEAGAIKATQLPLLLKADPEGSYLLGHFARANPHVEGLRRAPRARAIFQGEHGYISPSWMGDRTQAPTWNFQTVHFTVDVAFDNGSDAARAAVEELTNKMEQGRVAAWRPEELGVRYDRLIGGVIAFRARIREVMPKFKLGQNERPDVFHDILNGLRRDGSSPLAEAMAFANARRLDI